MNKFINKNLKIAFILVFLVLTFVLNLKVFAQAQTFNFSGNDPTSYQCLVNGVIQYNPDGSPVNPTKSGNDFVCAGGGLAVLRPPALQQVEVWFVRILYTIWALVGSLSFFLLVKLGYDYLISQGDVTKITAIRQKIIYYIVGFALVFLAVPVLSTVFNLLGINTSVQCYDVNMPGFQFFFATLCTDPRGLADPCNFTGQNYQTTIGKICPTPGDIKDCPPNIPFVCFKCIDDPTSSQYKTWQVRLLGGCTP